MKIICISDTHGQHWRLKIDPCDILIHCGDMDIQCISHLKDINEWFGQQPSKKNICIPGNHDRFLEREDKYFLKTEFTNACLLIHDIIKINCLSFFGSPFSPAFNNWSFEYQRCSEKAKRIWYGIPPSLDFLITHGPPYDVLDRNLDDERCGCEVLQREISRKSPKYHCFGHIHGEYGQNFEHDVQFINCSVLNEDYKLVNKPTIINI